MPPGDQSNPGTADDGGLAAWAAQHLGATVLAETALRPSATGGDGGLGLFARAALAPGDVLLRVPLSACLSLVNPRLREDEEALDLLAALARHGPQVKLAVLVALELARAPSQFEPWLARWPKATEGSLGWAEGGAEWSALARGLGEPAVRALHGQHLAMATRAWNTVLGPAAARAADGGEGACTSVGRLSWEYWLFALSMVLSRALDLRLNDESQLAIVPLVDMLNHTRGEGDSCRVRFDSGSQSFELVAAAHVEEGIELHICYGPKGNEELLACYGFALPQNNHDRLSLPLPMAPADEPPMVTMQKLGMLPSTFLKGLRHSDNGSKIASLEIVWDDHLKKCAHLSPEMLLLLRLSTLDPSELSELPHVFEGHPASPASEARAWAQLAAICNSALSSAEQAEFKKENSDGPVTVLSSSVRELAMAAGEFAKRRAAEAAAVPE